MHMDILRKGNVIVTTYDVINDALKYGEFDYKNGGALYAGEEWQSLLAEVIPYLAECQKQLGDQAIYLILPKKELQTLQSEIVRLAHSKMEDPVSLDV